MRYRLYLSVGRTVIPPRRNETRDDRRYAGKFVSAFILGIGFMMAGWTARKQALHDLMAETLVVRLRRPNDIVQFRPPAS